MIQTIKKSFLSGLVFLLTILIGFSAYGAWVNLLNQTNGDTINASIWNNIINSVNDIGGRTDNIYSTGGNIGIGKSNPQYKLDINGKVNATAYNLDIIRVTNSITTIGAKDVSVSCPVNYSIISGGCTTITNGGYLIYNYPLTNGWRCYSYDTYPQAYSTDVYALCVKTN